MKLPNDYEARMRELLGDDAEAYFAALDSEPVRAMRINRTKLTGDIPETEGVSLTESGIPDVYLFDGAAGGRNPLHHCGAYYIQELSAMFPVLSAPIEKGWRVLDLCAAPGGKTGQLAAAVGEDGFVVTNEYSAKRAKVLLGNVERMGYKNCAVYNSSPDRLCPSFSGAFDLVLVDAPCSGEGMFRKEPDAVQDWSIENSSGCAARQLEIMRSAAMAVKPGGYLLYSTCTFSPAEDEGLITSFIESDPRFSLVSVAPPTGAGELLPGIPYDGCATELCRRAYPHKVRGEGQFFGLLKRDDSPVTVAKTTPDKKSPREKSSPKTGIRDLTKDERTAATSFLRDFFGDGRELPLCVLGGDIFICTDKELPTDGLLACGVRLGELARDGRLVPHHHFFSAYGNGARLKLDLSPDDPLLEKYLHGEGFPTDDLPTGWGVITVCGCAVGGFRVAGGYLKNHYPKGLRS
ncbi:MAG: hypothetical protein E7578_08530 [Ruminococcaceae bacterium]|nr:hypothetical protein [Oscillospiraceae bacterium]